MFDRIQNNERVFDVTYPIALRIFTILIFRAILMVRLSPLVLFRKNMSLANDRLQL